MKKTHLFASMMLAAASFGFVACTSNSDNTARTTPGVPSIPNDELADPNPNLPDDPNATIPNLNYTVETEGGLSVIRIDLTGIQDPNDVAEWLRLYGTGLTNQNVWVEIDGLPKGFTIKNTIDEETGQVSAVDLVFLVDNSGSMGQEADAIARDIKAWAEKLSRTLDMRFGCVGYDGAITGALNITNVDDLKSYLDYNRGVYRTMHFAGDDADALRSAVAPYATGSNSWNECGAAALRFATDQFKFRAGSNRVFVNFTDEPNQPNGNPEYSTEWVKDPANWPTTLGTIHTVFSDDTMGYRNIWRDLYQERPWLMSNYTGGTSFFTSGSFNVNLDDLPITGALQNSYYIRITNVENLFDGQPHTVKITILSPDGTVRAEREFVVTFTR